MSTAITRDGGTIVLTRTDAEGVETITGHGLCATPDDMEGMCVARLFEASTELHALIAEAMATVGPQLLADTLGQAWVDRAQAALAVVSGEVA